MDPVSVVSSASQRGAFGEPGLNVLALNSGSSSLKFGLYSVGSSQIKTLLSGKVESIGTNKSRFGARDAQGKILLSETVAVASQREAIIRIGRLLADTKLPTPIGWSWKVK